MTTIKLRRGTAAEWTAANPVLADGEPGFERDTNQFKIGNGSTAWSSLEYFVDESSAGAVSSVNGDTGTVVLTASDVGAAPALGADDNYVTDAEKAALHTHDIVIAEGATQAAARTAIGAGTSDLDPNGVIAVDGLPILANGATTWETEANARNRYGLTSWSGRRRWVSIDYAGHPAPTGMVAGDLWDERPA